jgi:hypothetical protein
MPRGGARPGAGAKKGSKTAATISKEAAREALRQIVLREMDALVSAQIAQAKGLRYLVVRDKATGKFLRVSETMAKLGDGEERIEVWEKDPSTPAFTDIMNRALDKPKEQEMELRLSGEADMIAALHAGRERAKAQGK